MSAEKSDLIEISQNDLSTKDLETLIDGLYKLGEEEKGPQGKDLSETQLLKFFNNELQNSDLDEPDKLIEENNIDLIKQNNNKLSNIKEENNQKKNVNVVATTKIKISKESKTNNVPKKLGRKRKNSDSEGDHTKYSFDNKVRKSKRLFKDDLLEFINSKIKESNFTFYINGKEYKDDKVELLNINNQQIVNNNINFNRALFGKSIGEFYNIDISGDYNNYPKDFNAQLISKVYRSQNGEIVRKIFNQSYLKCLKYYRMDKDVFCKSDYQFLSGLEKGFLNLPTLLAKEGHDQQYINEIIDLIKNIEKIYDDKKPRRGRKNP
jgi:hypothetical protein